MGLSECMSHCSYVQSWIDKREVQSEKANLTILFERYVPPILEANRVGRFKKITPIQEVRMSLHQISIEASNLLCYCIGEHDSDPVLPAGDPAHS